MSQSNLRDIPNMQKHYFQRQFNELIEQIITNDEINDSEQVEEMILKLNRISQKNNGIVPQRLVNEYSNTT